MSSKGKRNRIQGGWASNYSQGKQVTTATAKTSLGGLERGSCSTSMITTAATTTATSTNGSTKAIGKTGCKEGSVQSNTAIMNWIGRDVDLPRSIIKYIPPEEQVSVFGMAFLL